MQDITTALPRQRQGRFCVGHARAAQLPVARPAQVPRSMVAAEYLVVPSLVVPGDSSHPVRRKPCLAASSRIPSSPIVATPAFDRWPLRCAAHSCSGACTAVLFSCCNVGMGMTHSCSSRLCSAHSLRSLSSRTTCCRTVSSARIKRPCSLPRLQNPSPTRPVLRWRRDRRWWRRP